MSKPRTLDPQQSASRTAAPAAQRIVPLAYRVDDAAAIIGVSDSKVWTLIREGRLPARRLDGSTVIRHEDLIAFVNGLPLVRQLAEPSVTPPPEPPLLVPRSAPLSPAVLSAPAQQPETPPHLRRIRAPASPSVAALPASGQPVGLPVPLDKKAPYGRGRTGKPLPRPDPNGWGVRTLRRPSPALAAIIGHDPISRPKALERIWKHIREGGLQREGDMRVIYADEKLRAVAGTDVITMYALEALIRPHLEAIT